MPELAERAELELVAASVTSGATVTEVARTIGRSPRTAARRMALPEVEELVAEQRREAARQILDGVVEGALLGLRRLVDTVADPDSPAGPAVSASKYLVDLAIGPGGVGPLRQALDRAERAAEPEPEMSTVDQIKRRLAEMHDAQADAERVLAAVERSRTPASSLLEPISYVAESESIR